MTRKLWAKLFIATCLGSALASAEEDPVAPPSLEIVISVAEQKLAVVKDGGLVRKYPISTSKFGLGDSNGSYKTPLGRLRVCDKVGDNLPVGAVLKSRNATGEILSVNAPGRDPIVTRILWLDGLDSGNSNARSRGIYIHGTVEESKLGQPVSYGCIRMRSRDVVEVFDCTPLGTPVEIISDRFPSFRKAAPKSDVLFASKDAMRTVFGPHGMVSVKTMRGAELAAGKTNPLARATPELLAGKSSAQTPKESATASKLPATASPPEPPISNGPQVVFKTPPPRLPEPNVVLAMNGSILDSGLAQMRKVAPAAKPPIEPRRTEPATSARTLVLQIVAPLELLAPSEEALRQMPLDRLSALLLNPPAPQFRLAFRASAEPPDL